MNAPNNSILTIRPYKISPATWVFDESALGIVKEPFVGEINEMIDRMLLRAGLVPGEQFTALFSATPFPGTHMILEKAAEENGGTWYTDVSSETEQEGWLCPCLFRFFCTAPDVIYVRAEL